jgi:hypothetical protein
MVGGRAQQHYVALAKERQKAHAGTAPGRGKTLPVNLPEVSPGDARDQAGKAVGVSGKSIDYAVKVLNQGVSELVAAVEQDKLAVSTAAAKRKSVVKISSQPIPRPRAREILAAQIGVSGKSIDYGAKELGIDETTAKALETAKPGEKVGDVMARAVAAEKEPLAKHGGPRETEQGDNITLAGRGTDGTYLTRRIARDRPDILARMKAGEFKSVRAAALEAGIVKLLGRPRQTISRWTAKKVRTTAHSGNGSKTSRVTEKIPASEHETIWQRWKDGESRTRPGRCCDRLRV